MFRQSFLLTPILSAALAVFGGSAFGTTCRFVIESQNETSGAVVDTISEDPIRFIEMARSRAAEAKAQGKTDFEVPELSTVTKEILVSIANDLDTSPPLADQLIALQIRGEKILANHVPYRELVRLVFQWSETVDTINRVQVLTRLGTARAKTLIEKAATISHYEFARAAQEILFDLAIETLEELKDTRPIEAQRLIEIGHAQARGDDTAMKAAQWVEASVKLAATTDRRFPFAPNEFLTLFHESYGRARLEELLEEAPNVLMVFMFGTTSIRTINRLRASGVLVHGLSRHPQYIDNFYLSPVEILFHDVGHSWLMKSQDRRYGLASTPERWLQYLNLERRIDHLAQHDELLAKVAEYYLFEVDHERGYPFDVFINTNEINTEMWVDTILKKLQTKFWAKNPVPDSTFGRLNEARLWLLEQFRELLEEAIERRFQAVKDQPHRVAVVPLQRSERGLPVGGVIAKSGTIYIEAISNKGETFLSDIFNFSVSQVPAEIDGLLDQPETLTLIRKHLDRFMPMKDGERHLTSYELFKMRQLRHAEKKHTPLPFSYRGVGTTYQERGLAIEGAPGQKMLVLESGRRVPLHLVCFLP
ncbi:MAG TPA: hypothetical protein PLH57_03710 [Oligoflexia bacterium]|nr:hypothetical protein [Oligoflexia bacterium]